MDLSGPGVQVLLPEPQVPLQARARPASALGRGRPRVGAPIRRPSRRVAAPRGRPRPRPVACRHARRSGGRGKALRASATSAWPAAWPSCGAGSTTRCSRGWRRPSRAGSGRSRRWPPGWSTPRRRPAASAVRRLGGIVGDRAAVGRPAARRAGPAAAAGRPATPGSTPAAPLAATVRTRIGFPVADRGGAGRAAGARPLAGARPGRHRRRNADAPGGSGCAAPAPDGSRCCCRSPRPASRCSRRACPAPSSTPTSASTRAPTAAGAGRRAVRHSDAADRPGRRSPARARRWPAGPPRWPPSPGGTTCRSCWPTWCRPARAADRRVRGGAAAGARPSRALVAAGRGRRAPAVVAAEWSAAGLRPLAAWAGGRYVPAAPPVPDGGRRRGPRAPARPAGGRAGRHGPPALDGESGPGRRPGRAGRRRHALLEAAAVAVTYRRAGVTPSAGQSRCRPRPPRWIGRCPPPPAPGCGGSSATAARRAARRRRRSCSPNGSAWPPRHGGHVPPETLPALLDAGRRNGAIRPALGRVAGRRGAWLAAMRDDWRWLLDEARPAVPNPRSDLGDRFQRRTSRPSHPPARHRPGGRMRCSRHLGGGVVGRPGPLPCRAGDRDCPARTTTSSSGPGRPAQGGPGGRARPAPAAARIGSVPADDRAGPGRGAARAAQLRARPADRRPTRTTGPGPAPRRRGRPPRPGASASAHGCSRRSWRAPRSRSGPRRSAAPRRR